jgi:hypothetical protein
MVDKPPSSLIMPLFSAVFDVPRLLEFSAPPGEDFW